MFNRGGFPAQRPMGHTPMNQPSMNLPGMNMTGMNMSGMNLSGMSMPGMTMSGMGMSPMNQPNMNLTGMNHPGMNHQRMGHPGMTHQNMGLSGMSQPNMNMNLNRMNQPSMNLNRMNHPDINQGGGMGFRPEMNNQAFGMRPMDNTGVFGGGNTDSMGMSIRPAMHTPDMLMGPQVVPQRFSSPSVPMHHGQPRMPTQTQEIPSIVNRVVTHSSDPMMMKPKAPLQEPAHVMKKTQWDTNVYGNEGQDMGMKLVPSGPSLDNASNVKNRYTNESASSILESFGLSNEDLEELSRYPDDQLTPGNMPAILRDIRLRKISRPASVPEQTPERRPASEAAPSNVIDYGHSSKYKYNEPATSVRSYDAPRTAQKPPQAKKETVAPSIAVSQITPEKKMDNKIPTLSGSRKPVWHSSKPARSNNKTLVGQPTTPAPVKALVTVPTNENLETVSTTENPVIAVKEDATAIPDVTPPVYTELTPAVQIVAGVSQVTYQQPAEKPAASKEGYVPVLSQEEAQKMKKLPTPSMMNDYYAASPRIFPHICSLCNVECRHLKDWIKHQNNTSHIESCRNLHQQYPDWNPQVLSSLRNEGKKDEPASKKSKSKSPSPRRSGSRHRVRKSRSHSPKSGGRRSRSRSPHRSRHSPKRSRSPRRGTRSPLRSRSPRRHTQSSHSKSPDKKAVDAAVQSFIEATKFKCGPRYPKPSNGKKATSKPYNPNDRSKKPAISAPTPKKSDTTASKSGSTSNSSSSSTRPSSAQTPKKSITAASRSGSSSSSKPSSSSSSSSKPSYTSSATKKSTYGSSNTKKPVVSSGAKKTTMSTSSGKKTSPFKWSAPKIPPPGAPFSNRINKFIAKNNNKIIHVTNLPDKGYSDQDILKLAEPFGKVCDILIIRSRNEAFMETNFKEAAAAAVKYSESVPVKINNKQVTLSLFGQKKTYVKSPEQNEKVEPAKSAAQTDLPPGFIKCYMLEDPPLKHDDKCVILISNLPDSKYTVDEITNLAKPFGGVTDVLVVSTHKEAYLQLPSRTSLDSMIKFYNVFPTYLGGNLLSISVAGRYKDLKNEDLIFADLIEQASYKITPSIYETFVHLTNLPETPVEDFEIIRVGLRFGRVEHHVIFSNKQKAIVHLHSPSAAKAMHSFLSQYPCSIGENVIKCSLPSQTTLAEDEYRAYIEEDKPSHVINTENPKAPESKEPEVTENPKAPESKKPDVTEKPSAPDSKKPDVTEKPTAPDSKKPSVTEKTAPDSKKPSVTEKPTAPDSKKPSVTEKPTAPDSKKPSVTEKPTAPDSKKPSVTEKPTAPEFKKPSVTEKPTAPEFKKPSITEQPTAPEFKKPSVTEKPAAPESKKPSVTEEKLTAIDDTQSENEPAPPSPISDTEMEVDSAEPEESSAPEGSPKPEDASAPPACITEVTSDTTSAESPAEPSTFYMVATDDDDDDDDDDEEEAAQAPEASDSSPLYIQAEPETYHPEPLSVSHPQWSEELEVLVSVESDEEESEELEHIPLGTEKDIEASADEGTSDSPEAERKQGHLLKANLNPAGKAEEKNLSKLKAAATSAKGKAGKEGPESGATSSASIRTTKYNAQKGEISVTVTLESQRATLKTVDSRKRSSRERGTSYYETSTPRSSSNRSSPADSASSHSKSGSKKSTGKYVTSQPDRDSKDIARTREREARTSSRKDDRTRGSTSSRYSRSSKSNNWSPRSKEKELEESFPFNLDEFVTVDEIVEEHIDPKKNAREPDTARKGKRKENDSVTSETKKSRMVSGESPELSFVTLDEVGDEEESACAQENKADKTAQSLVTEDEMATEEVPAIAKDKQMLMTLDEISDDDEAQDPSTVQLSSAMPKTSNKGQLVVSEEQTAATVMPKVEEPKLVQETKDAAVKEVDCIKEPEEKQKPEGRQDTPAKRDHLAQPLVTLDEVKTEDDDEMSFADIEHQFLTVDEVGDEEEESENKPKPDGDSKSSKAKVSDQSKASEPTPPARRGRPRKRPLPESAEGNKVSLQQAGSPHTSKGAVPSSIPAEAKLAKDGATTTGKPADKRSKLETPPAGKTKLAPYNSSTAVGLEFLIPKTGYFCELCSLFYMDDSSKLKHCRSLRHYQQVEKHLDTLPAAPEEKSSSTL
ncbi:zinc finger protein 638 [Dendrobates tinctorius]|uniref:zinc finger protein 638 n=1 Tax=Dendrobates tinctorius TaxID=92724 RepID=UPI003CC928E2